MNRINVSPERGKITQEITDDELGAGITKEAIKFIAYIHDRCHNVNCLDGKKISRSERQLLNRWCSLGFVETSELDDMIGFAVTEEFYDFMCLVMKSSYARPSCIIESKVIKND